MPQVSEFSWKVTGLKMFFLLVATVLLLFWSNSSFSKNENSSLSFFTYLFL